MAKRAKNKKTSLLSKLKERSFEIEFSLILVLLIILISFLFKPSITGYIPIDMYREL